MGKAMHERLLGREVRPPLQPPVVVERPWNTITVVTGFTGDKTVTIKDLVPVMWTQAGFQTPPSPLMVRIRSIRVWALSYARPIRLYVFGFTDGGTSSRPRQILIDWPAPQRLPRCGWVYSDAIQSGCFSETSTEKVFGVDVGKTNSDGDIPWLCYVDMLWRGATDTPISAHPRIQLLELQSAGASGSSPCLSPSLPSPFVELAPDSE